MPQPPSPGTAARPPRAPKESAATATARKAGELYRREREAVERRSVLRGLLLLALVMLLVGVLHGGWQRFFYAGWWRQW